MNQPCALVRRVEGACLEADGSAATQLLLRVHRARPDARLLQSEKTEFALYQSAFWMNLSKE